MKKDATKQCKCWAEAKKEMEDIKKSNCFIFDDKKAVAKQKKKCKDAFKVCKKAEHICIELIANCMGDHSLQLLNMTGASLNEGAMDNTKEELSKAEEKAKNILKKGRNLEYLDLDV